MMAASMLEKMLLVAVLVCLAGISTAQSLSESTKVTPEDKEIKEQVKDEPHIDLLLSDDEFVSPLRMRSTLDTGNSGSVSGGSVRGATSVGIGGKDDTASKRSWPLSLLFPPIPPFHPRHVGSIHYSSIMKDGTITYRREINAPCDNGMLIFTVGVASKEKSYEYELYDEAYLYSDNTGLCILYPTYTGYQISSQPFWTMGVDPETVTFTNLISDPSSMHRVSSRELKIINPKNSTNNIEKDKLGDYIIMAKHNFYNVDYYKQLKAYINSWKTRDIAETRRQEATIATDPTMTMIVVTDQ